MALVEEARPGFGNHRDHGVVAEMAAAVDVGGADGQHGVIAVQMFGKFQGQAGHDVPRRGCLGVTWILVGNGGGEDHPNGLYFGWMLF
ncbi:hypothetical protein D3C78_1611950 [compost metagenome]